MIVVVRDDPRPTDGDGGELVALRASIDPSGTLSEPARLPIADKDVAPGVASLLPRPGGALVAWLRAPEDSVHELRDEAMLRLFFADALPLEDALEIVRTMRRRHEAALARLRSVEGGARSMRQRFPYVTLQAGIEIQTSLVRWCARMERELLDSSEAVA